MSESSCSLSSLARSKLHLSGSLHRWVLLKNSITQADSSPANSTTLSDNIAEVEDEEITTEDTDSFMFPDAGKLVDNSGSTNSSEAQWLDSLLKDLGDDEDDDFGVDNSSVLQADDDYDQLSPLPSPNSSSDDLINQSYISSYPYLVPYPPFHPPLVNPHHFDSSIFVSPSPYVDPLPYYELDDDVADLPVPDAIEDISDDESDSPSIQSSSSLNLANAATIPLPADRPRLHIFVDPDYTSFYPYELDPNPLPFSSNNFCSPYNLYQQEC